MDFLGVAPSNVPKYLYQTQAVIHVGAPSSRRASLTHSQDGEDNTLTRIISGGRRKSQSGSLKPEVAAPSGLPAETGTWYWRARAGVTSESLVVLPLSTNPANPLLSERPPPLSQALPTKAPVAAPKAEESHEGIGAKIRRLSAGFIHKPEHTHAPTPADGAIPEGKVEAAPAETAADGSVSHDVATANTARVPVEKNWPGVVEGHQLAAVIVPLHYLKKDSVELKGTDKTGWHVIVNIGSAISGKSGVLTFDFDKDWVGGKAEAELLYDGLVNGISHASPLFRTVQLGGSTGAPAHHTEEVAPGDKQYQPGWQDEVRGKW